jgi:hypothetical protein
MEDDPKNFATELVSFLEDSPLYRRKDLTQPKPPSGSPHQGERKSVSSSQLLPENGFLLPNVLKIEMPCRQSCGDRRTFEWKPPQELAGALLGAPPSRVMTPGRAYQLSFICTHCSQHRISFLIHVDRIDEATVEGFSLTKAGQWPSVRPKVDRVLERALGKVAAPLYEKGLTAEAHNFGIGAFAYYRRVAENTIDSLLADLRAYAETTGARDLVSALDTVKNEQQASKRIDAVKGLLPPALCPNGLNPLRTIYQAVSDGLHGRDDEHCLELAADLRTSIDFLITTMARQKAAADQYIAATQRLRKAAEKSNNAK